MHNNNLKVANYVFKSFVPMLSMFFVASFFLLLGCNKNGRTGFVAINSKPAYKCHADVFSVYVSERIAIHSVCSYYIIIPFFFSFHLWPEAVCTKQALCFFAGVKLWCGFVKMHKWKVNM